MVIFPDYPGKEIKYMNATNKKSAVTVNKVVVLMIAVWLQPWDLSLFLQYRRDKVANINNR